MSSWLLIVLFLILGSVLLESLALILNLRALSTDPPEDFADLFSPERYATSQEYIRAQSRISLLAAIIIPVFSLAFLLLGGFGAVADLVRGFGIGEILSGLIYVAILTILASIVSIPFNVYATFVIEEKC